VTATSVSSPPWRLIVLFVQELWEANTQAFDETDVDLPKHVAEAALQEGTYADINEAQDELAALQFQEAPERGAAPREPAFKDTGAAGSSDDDAQVQEAPVWTCSCVTSPG
jgi:hypothetical protein